MGGRVTFPAGGWYHASKYAVEALSDALRVEVASLGIRVVLVEPGLIRTEFGSVASSGLTGAGSDGPYAAIRAAADSVTEQNYRSRLAAGPDAVAKVVPRKCSCTPGVWAATESGIRWCAARSACLPRWRNRLVSLATGSDRSRYA
jgi:NAD(P)-dependent dehydrogenase (short-subunit alcohol dehydrogenase family)